MHKRYIHFVHLHGRALISNRDTVQQLMAASKISPVNHILCFLWKKYLHAKNPTQQTFSHYIILRVVYNFSVMFYGLY